MRREARELGALLMGAYMVSYLTRINYGAVLVEMVAATGLFKPELSAAVTGAFITYGAGQVVSGFWGDRIQPKRLVFIGFLGTTVINALLPVWPDPRVMTALWCVNGFAQAFLWPPMVRLMAGLLTDREYARVMMVVSWGSSAGTMLLYLLAPLLVSLSGWRGVFRFCALCGVLVMPIWLKRCPDLPAAPLRQSGEGGSVWAAVRLLCTPVMLLVLLCIILQGALRDSVTTWLPTYVSEVYRLGSGISILTGVILPVFSVLCFRVAEALYERALPDPVVCAAALFAAGTAFGLLLLTGCGALVSVLALALLAGCMHGVNLMLVCMLPSCFKQTGQVSLISGLLNACTYLGSALSTYGVALLSDSGGWLGTIRLWVGLAAAGTVLCLVCGVWMSARRGSGAICGSEENAAFDSD